MTAGEVKTNPKLDLVLERVVDVPKELVWKAWTTPELIMQWFTPAPWKTVECNFDLRPGGACYTVMESPEGQKFPNPGCFLEVRPNEKLVFTSCLGADYRPAPDAPQGLPMTAMIELEEAGPGKTKYTATVLHANEEHRARHDAMGFHAGWGKALDQLVELMKSK